MTLLHNDHRPAPGYDKASTRAVTVREMIRMRGVWRLPLTFILMKFIMRPKGGIWMPGICAESCCQPDELSQPFWHATEPQRAAIEQLGFAPCFHAKLKRNLNPMYLDEGGITYLHTDRSHVCTLVYVRLHLRAPLNQIREKVVVGFSAAFQDGVVSFTNSKSRFDSLPGREAVIVKSADPKAIYERFVSYLKSQPQTARVFVDCAAVRDWLDACRLEAFEARVARGLFVRMTDAEVEQARRKMTQPLS